MKIYVLFKTHLDIGFTDFSANVVKKYNEKYIPDAIRVAEEIASMGRKEGFVWTTGSWLIHQYLKQANEENRLKMEKAIENGWISWHGLPCTFHSEVADSELYDYGLSLFQDLDKRFHRQTIGAKYTDVPGHTCAIIPHLQKSGISFLHIGINPASAAVDVPLFFRWRYHDSEISVMYNGGDYGEFTPIPHTNDYILFAHTGDNMGPQSAEEILKVYDDLYEKYPDAEIIAGDLNTIARAVEKIKDSLPVVEAEIGDTWIHGAGTDPQKMSQFKSLLRFASSLSPAEQKKVYSHLLLIPEHTWGLNENKHLLENKDYIRPLFDKVRNNYKYKKMELSWAEQRKYVLDAVEELDGESREKANEVIEKWNPPKVDFSTLTPCGKTVPAVKGLTLAFDENGAVSHCEYQGKVFADPKHKLFAFSYDEYNFDDVWQFQLSYLKPKFIDDYLNKGDMNWAILDFGKPGLDKEKTEHITFTPHDYTVYYNDTSVIVRYGMNEQLTKENGLPEEALLVITPQNGQVEFDFRWYGKPANRVPEALWLSFCPPKPLTGISKLGYTVSPTNIVSKGGRGLHATDGKLFFDDITVELLDSALVSVGKKNVNCFDNALPDTEKGVFFNLFNNQWGTNFPMWNEGNARFRFLVK